MLMTVSTRVASAFRCSRRSFSFLVLLMTTGLAPVTTLHASDTDIVCVETALVANSAPAPEVDQISALRADGEDLRVEIRWGSSVASHASVSLLDDTGGTVSTSLVERQGDQVEIVLASALEAVPDLGFQFSVQVTPLDDPTASDKIGFRVDLSCPNDEPCSFTLLPGVWSDGPIIPSDLLGLLDDAAGSNNLFAQVWDDHPEQRPALRSLLWQLGLAEPPGAGLDADDDCDCLWLTSTSAPGPQLIGPPEGNTPRQSAGFFGANSYVAAAVQSVGGTMELDLDDHWYQVALGMHLRCLNIASVETVLLTTSLPSRPEISVGMPDAEGCEACPATITSDVAVNACVEGQTSGMVTESGSTLSYLYALNGASLLANSVMVTAWHPEGAYSHQQKGADGTLRRETQAPDAVGRIGFKTLLNAAVSAEGNGPTLPYAFAASRFAATLTAAGQATCAERNGSAVLVGHPATYLGDITGGVLMEQWGP